MVPINIETGRLAAAVSPGKVSGDQYTPPTDDQKVTFTQGGIEIEIDIDYAEHVHKRRRIYPAIAKMRPWTRSALSAAAETIMAAIKRKLQ